MAGRSFWDGDTPSFHENWVELDRPTIARAVPTENQCRDGFSATNDEEARLHLTNPPNIESVIEKVAYWKANSNSLDAVYYLYVFQTLRALEGSQVNKETALRYLEECRTLARFRRNRTKSLEWYGPGAGIKRLVHHSRLGEWQKDKEFWEISEPLERITGRISKIQEPQSGQIEILGGLGAFFVPAKGGYFRNNSENQNASFFLGFSYDGLRAWEVNDA